MASQDSRFVLRLIQRIAQPDQRRSEGGGVERPKQDEGRVARIPVADHQAGGAGQNSGPEVQAQGIASVEHEAATQRAQKLLPHRRPPVSACIALGFRDGAIGWLQKLAAAVSLARLF